MDQVGVPYGVYIPDTHEIMPVMLVKLANTTLAYGRVRVKGAGLLADTAVDPMNVVRTVCGSWIFSKTGYYFYELEVRAAAVFLRQSRNPFNHPGRG